MRVTEVFQEGQSEFAEAVEKMNKRLVDVPAEFWHDFKKYEVKTKSGEILKCESRYFFTDFRNNETEFHESRELKTSIFCYLVARNVAGEIVGMRIVPLFQNDRSMDAFSKIIVRDKGKGYGSALDEVYVQLLQDFADEYDKNVVWNISNENLDKLNTYKAEDKADPTKVSMLEEEQKRWQSLYGDGGKFGIVKGKRVFRPSGVKILISDTKSSVNETL